MSLPTRVPKQHHDLKEKTMDNNNRCLLVHNPCTLFCQYPRAVIKTLESTLKAGVNTQLLVCDDKGVFRDDEGTVTYKDGTPVSRGVGLDCVEEMWKPGKTYFSGSCLSTATGNALRVGALKTTSRLSSSWPPWWQTNRDVFRQLGID